jgi:hypothetical protein
MEGWRTAQFEGSCTTAGCRFLTICPPNATISIELGVQPLHRADIGVVVVRQSKVNNLSCRPLAASRRSRCGNRGSLARRALCRSAERISGSTWCRRVARSAADLSDNQIIILDETRLRLWATLLFALRSREKPLSVRLDRDLFDHLRRTREDIFDISACGQYGSHRQREHLTYSSTARCSKGAGLLHIGHIHCGPCSWSWRYAVASKHWM